MSIHLEIPGWVINGAISAVVVLLVLMAAVSLLALNGNNSLLSILGSASLWKNIGGIVLSYFTLALPASLVAAFVWSRGFHFLAIFGGLSLFLACLDVNFIWLNRGRNQPHK